MPLALQRRSYCEPRINPFASRCASSTDTRQNPCQDWCLHGERSCPTPSPTHHPITLTSTPPPRCLPTPAQASVEVLHVARGLWPAPRRVNYSLVPEGLAAPANAMPRPTSGDRTSQARGVEGGDGGRPQGAPPERSSARRCTSRRRARTCRGRGRSRARPGARAMDVVWGAWAAPDKEPSTSPTTMAPNHRGSNPHHTAYTNTIPVRTASTLANLVTALLQHWHPKVAGQLLATSPGKSTPAIPALYGVAQKLPRSCPKVAEHLLQRPRLGRGPASLDVGHVWPMQSRFRPKLSKCNQNWPRYVCRARLDKHGKMLAENERPLDNIDRGWSNLVACWSKFAPNRPSGPNRPG